MLTFIEVHNRMGEPVYINTVNIQTVGTAHYAPDNMIMGIVTTARGNVLARETASEIMKMIEKKGA